MKAPTAARPGPRLGEEVGERRVHLSGLEDPVHDFEQRAVVADVAGKDHVRDCLTCAAVETPERDALDERSENGPAARAEAVAGVTAEVTPPFASTTPSARAAGSGRSASPPTP